MVSLSVSSPYIKLQSNQTAQVRWTSIYYFASICFYLLYTQHCAMHCGTHTYTHTMKTLVQSKTIYWLSWNQDSIPVPPKLTVEWDTLENSRSENSRLENSMTNTWGITTLRIGTEHCLSGQKRLPRGKNKRDLNSRWKSAEKRREMNILGKRQACAKAQRWEEG